MIPSISLSSQQTDTTEMNTAINHAIHYLNTRIDQNHLYPMVIPILIPLKQYYHLPISGKIDSLWNNYANNRNPRMSVYNAYFKYSSRSKNDQIKDTVWSGIDALNTFSLYCTKSISKKSFYTLCDSSLSWGGYDLTHVYFASLVLRKTKCICKSELDQLEEKALKKMVHIIPTPTQENFSDLDFEVVAFLLYGNHRELISERIVKKILLLQNMNGYWQDANTYSDSLRDHSTVLALWALLEWKYSQDKTLYLPYNQQND